MLIILKETPHYIVLNKPAGLITEKNEYEDSLEEKVYLYLEESKKNPFVGLVHRLDRVTSGVILFAKKKSVLIFYNALVEKKQLKKIYWALTKEKVNPKKTQLTHYLVKKSKEKKSELVPADNKQAKKCQLQYQLLERKEGISLLEIRPFTGRFHQIRVQLAFMNMPLVGDRLYSKKGATKSHVKEIGLHAHSLRFLDFESKEEIELKALIPLNDIWKPFN